MTEDQPVLSQSILSKLTDVERERETLIAAARMRRDEILAELAGLCAPKLLGPLSRQEVPDGILRRRERKVAKVVKARKAKAEAGA